MQGKYNQGGMNMEKLGYYVRWNGDCRDDYYPAGCFFSAKKRVKKLIAEGFSDAHIVKEAVCNFGTDRFGNRK